MVRQPAADDFAEHLPLSFSSASIQSQASLIRSMTRENDLEQTMLIINSEYLLIGMNHPCC